MKILHIEGIASLLVLGMEGVGAGGAEKIDTLLDDVSHQLTIHAIILPSKPGHRSLGIRDRCVYRVVRYEETV